LHINLYIHIQNVNTVLAVAKYNTTVCSVWVHLMTMIRKINAFLLIKKCSSNHQAVTFNFIKCPERLIHSLLWARHLLVNRIKIGILLQFVVPANSMQVHLNLHRVSYLGSLGGVGL
jgi:hypothetical protein